MTNQLLAEIEMATRKIEQLQNAGEQLQRELDVTRDELRGEINNRDYFADEAERLQQKLDDIMNKKGDGTNDL